MRRARRLLKRLLERKLTAIYCLVSAVALAAAVAHVDTARLLSAMQRVPAADIAAMAAMMLLGSVLASARLKVMAAGVGRPMTMRDALLALSVGNLAGAASIQFFGQIVARNSLLKKRGFEPSDNIAIAIYERAVAVLTAMSLAVYGAVNLFGAVTLDLAGGGGALVKLLAGLVVAFAASAWATWRFLAMRSLLRLAAPAQLANLAANAVISFATQASTAGCYVLAAHALAPTVALDKLVSASFVVMFAASIPISFSGWGIRELSAIVTLTNIGMDASSAVTVAILVGAMAMLAAVATALIAVLMPQRAAGGEGMAVRDGDRGQGVLDRQLTLLVSLTATVLVLFQIYVPVRETRINVNLADPVVLLGGLMFVYRAARERPAWRVPGTMTGLALLTGVMALSWLHGLAAFGWNDWAFGNKFVGWFFLMAYAATGAALPEKLGLDGFAAMTESFTAALGAVLGLELVLMAAAAIDLVSTPFVKVPLEAFSQNRNALAFLITMATAALGNVGPSRRFWLLGVFLAAQWETGSRAGYGATVVLLCLSAWLRALTVRDIGKGLLLAVAVIGVFSAIPAVFGIYDFDALHPALSNPSSNAERLKSILGGLSLFLEHPVFGAGLGGYVASQGPSDFVIIHSTPVWLLAETGIVGLLCFAAVGLRIVYREWPGLRIDPVSNTIVLAMVAFAMFSAVHEMLYQRSFWLLLGAALAVPLRDTANGRRFKRAAAAAG